MSEEFTQFIVSVVLIVIACFGMGGCLKSCSTEGVKIFNDRCGTSYTAHQYFWASSEMEKACDKNTPERPKPYTVEVKK